jgi:hypothetical protein
MKTLAALVLTLLLPVAVAPAADPMPTSDAPSYTPTGELKLPANYREWVFLTSGLDMNYNDPSPVAGHSLFQNVFVNPSSYHAFLATGAWPDKTTFILELRAADAHVNIDKRGQSQVAGTPTVEIHVKDESHLPAKWGFYNMGKETTGKLIARPATCYTCHEAHAAVDTTFVQFYPTLLPVATEKKTLSKAYLEDTDFLPAPPK